MIFFVINFKILIMKKLIKYPSQALSYIHEGQIMVLMSNDIEKVSIALMRFQVLVVREKLKKYVFYPSIQLLRQKMDRFFSCFFPILRKK